MSRRASTLLVLVALVGIGSCAREQPAAKEKDKTVWMDPNTIQRGPIRHEALTDDQMSRLEALHRTFADVDGQTLEQWVDDFKRDADPDANLKIWEDMQLAYQTYCRKKDLDLATRKEVFKVVLLRSMTSENQVLLKSQLKILSEDEARQIMKAYPSPPEPIQVFKKR